MYVIPFIFVLCLKVRLLPAIKKRLNKVDGTFETHNDKFCEELESYLKKINIGNEHAQKIKGIADLKNYIIFGYNDNTIVMIKAFSIVIATVGFLFTVGMLDSDIFNADDSSEQYTYVQQSSFYEINKNEIVETYYVGDLYINKMVIIPILVVIFAFCFIVAVLSYIFDILAETKNEVLQNIDKYIANLEEEEKEKQNLENIEKIVSKVFENKFKELELEKQQAKQEDKHALSNYNIPQTVKQMNFGCVNINVPKNPFSK